MNKKAKIGLIIGIVALVCVLAVVLVLVFTLNRDNEHEHTLMHIQAVDATCTEDGSVEYWTCSECGKNFADMDAANELDTIIVSALGHDFGEYSVIKEATCTESGEEIATCSRCEATLSREIEALGHAWNDGEVSMPATCLQEGVMTYTCGRCDEIRTEKIEKQPHTPGEEVRENIINASCETAGSYDIVVYCTVCNEEISRNTQSIAALGHSWGNGTQIKAPTCTETGTRVYTCSRCNDSREESVAALGHDWNDGIVMTEPTCTVAGVCLFECSRCDETKTESINALGHDPAEAVRENEVATSCEEPGSYDLVVYCGRCGEELSREHIEVAVLGHNWDEGEVTKEPTCTEEGVRTFTCTRCGETKEEAVAELGHDWNDGEITTPATCLQEGTMTYTCERCGDTRTQQIEKLPHAPGEAIYENEKEATCVEDGSYDVVVKCTECGTELSRVTNIVTALGHKITDTWAWNEDVHYKTCANDLTERLDIGEHTFSNGKCLVCGCLEKIEPTEGLEYSLSSDRTYFVVRGLGSATETDIIIPAELNGIPVTAIGNNAFDYTSITSLSIPDSITLIGEDAFLNCSSLKSVTIGEGLSLISDNAFLGCSIESVYISDIFAWCNIDFKTIRSNPAIGASLYLNGQLVTDLKIPNGIVKIKDYAFYAIPTLTSVAIGEDVQSIGNYAFYACSSLSNIILGNSVKSIGVLAFAESAIGSIVIPDSVASIGSSAFSRCFALENVLIGNGISAIENNVFRYCSLLESVEIGNSVESIGINAFYQCKSLKSVTIPDSVIYIEDEAFYECGQLESVIIGNGVLYIGESAFEDCLLESAIIGNNVLYIGERAFQGCGFKNIIIPDSVITIDEYAFDNCALESVEIGTGVVRVGYSAFNCSSLKSVHIKDLAAWCSIGFGSGHANPLYDAKNLYLNGELVIDLVIPDGVTTIKNGFEGCTSIKSVTIPESVTNIDYNIFSMSSLEEITLPASAIKVIDSGQDRLRKVTITSGTTISSSFSGLESLSEVILSDSVINIASDVFQDCENLEFNEYNYALYLGTENNPYYALIRAQNSYLVNCEVHSDTKVIADGAFSGCSMLTNISIPDGIKSIGDTAFDGCYLQYNELDGLSYLGNSNNPYVLLMDVKTYNIQNANINSETKVIYPNAFYNANSLTSIIIPAGITTISNSAFANCTSLKSVTIPEGVSIIGDYAFANCTSLENVKIPNSVKYIGEDAFQNCTALKNLIIGNGIDFIGDAAFTNCTSLESVHITDIAAWCSIDFSSMSSNPLFNTNKLYLNGELLTDLVIPNNIEVIGQYAFANCSFLKSITLSDSITKVSGYAFYNCISLERLLIGKNLSNIGNHAFDRCSTNLESIAVSEGNQYYYSYENCLIDSASKTLILGCKNSVIPIGILSIGDYAFYDCNSLVNVILPDSILWIGDYAFYGCESLTEVLIPDRVISIGSYAFRNCLALSNVVIGSNVKWIGCAAFYQCELLKDVTFKTTYGWRCSTLDSMINSIAITEYSIIHSSTLYLTSTYVNYYWFRR